MRKDIRATADAIVWASAEDKTIERTVIRAVKHFRSFMDELTQAAAQSGRAADDLSLMESAQILTSVLQGVLRHPDHPLR